jgi:hypothetical protein
MIYLDRIEELRKLMLNRGWDAVLFTGSDPHSSEYPAERWKQVRWLTGFTGECGDVVLTQDHAGLWTDTRYFIQANEQLEGTGVELHKMRVPEQVPIPQWLAENFSEEDEFVLAIDGYCVSAGFAAEIENAFLQKDSRCEIVSVPDLLSLLWTDRPQIPQTPIFTVNSGESRCDRLQRLRDFMASKGCTSCLISALDEIAWLLNLRASDIEYNPLVISYLLVEEQHAYFYVLKGPIEDESTEAAFDELAERLQDAGIQAITIHGRTRCQMYKGEADWSLIGEVKRNPRMHIPIIGNGDIVDGLSAKAAFDNYGVDGIMLGRATFGHPWIFREIKYFLDKGELMPEPSVVEKVTLAKRHLGFSLEVKGEPRGIYEMRRHLSCYFKALPDFRETRIRMVTTLDRAELFGILDEIAERWGAL